MILERVPSFLPSPFQYDNVYFDQNGRFVYVQRQVESDPCPVFFVYDIVFNSYVELTADSSITDFERGEFKFVENSADSILPVDSQTIIVVLIGLNPNSILLVLIRFDFANKKYGLIDSRLYSYCEKPLLARDDETFVILLLSTCKDGRVVETGEELEVYALETFTIEADRFKPGKWIELDHDKYELPGPDTIHLRHNKLWYTRSKRFTPLIHGPSGRHLDYISSPTAHYQPISYFDLTDTYPTEITVGNIEDKSCSNEQWVQDSLFIQQTPTECSIFDLNDCNWSSMQINVPNEDDLVTFWGFEKDHFNRIAYELTVDKHYDLVFVDKKQGSLHRVPLRTPFRLVDIAWTSVLNAGLQNKAKPPYTQLF
ncbi:hypothetical protein M3Y98_00490500 [Aphelenchoides besseyi]|nr:hypothetical protein M3Y98_00490500 [Aphelenchoides besseyi]KAI6207667.1 hypothetical protein M3Y96_00033200 [Aphelenchoides besseyi]